MNPSPCSLFLLRKLSRCWSHLRCWNAAIANGSRNVLRHKAVKQVAMIFTMVAVLLLATNVRGQERGDVDRPDAVSESEWLIDQSRRARVKSEELLAAIPHLVQRESSRDELVIEMDAWIARQAAGLYSIEFELNLGDIFEEEKIRIGQGVDPPEKSSTNRNGNQVLDDRNSTFHPTVFAKPLDSAEPDRKKEWNRIQLPVLKLKTKNDRQIAVANNLIDLGHFTAACRILEKVLQTDNLDPLDYKWVLFQLARCERNRKNPVEAEKWLRLVARQRTTDIVSETAEWWLKQQDRRRQLQEGLELGTRVSDR